MTQDTVFWNVDTQYDFIDPEGKLPVGENQEGARNIEEALSRVTEIARDNKVTVVNTADWHNENTEELSDNPDFRETFPPHCMADSRGAEYIEATKPEDALYLDWQDEVNREEIDSHEGDFVLYKDAFDVFAGEPESPHAETVLDSLEPDTAVVYGVATDVCVDYAVNGLLERGVDVYLVEDAVKGIDPDTSQNSIDEWGSNSVTVGSTEDLERYLEQ